MSFQPYMVIAIERLPKKKDEEEKLPKVVLEPTVIIAKDDKSAATKVLITNDSLKSCDPDRLELYVRPF